MLVEPDDEEPSRVRGVIRNEEALFRISGWIAQSCIQTHGSVIVLKSNWTPLMRPSREANATGRRTLALGARID
jgi:hypothetical protein